MVELFCEKNYGYKWTKEKNICFKGYLQDEQGIVYKGQKAIDILLAIQSFEAFKEYLKTIYGVFLVVIKQQDEIWIANDVAGSIPFYYTDDARVLSDDVDAIVRFDDRYSALDPIRTFELYAVSYVGYNNTVFQHIKQLQIGVACRIKNGGVDEQPYFVHKGSASLTSEEKEIDDLQCRTNAMIQRIIRAIDGRPVVISLSGGYDSRYVACSLKDNGIDNVTCYTYGREGSFEVIQSKKVADALGFNWYNVQYDADEIRNLINEDGYLDYSNRPDYIAYLQNFYAVKKLKEEGKIPSNAVFVTGLCNDMPTGFYIPDEEKAKSYGYSNEGVAQYNIEQRFIKFNITDEAKEIFKLDILTFLSQMNIEVNDYNSFISALDCVETSGFHTHCYLNMNAVHDFLGYEWLLPCWDRDMLQFWYDLSPELRIHQYMYEKYITEYIGKKYGVGTKKHIEMSAPTPFLDRLKRMVGGIIVRIAYPLGLPVKRNTDINNFARLEVELYKAISQKKAVKADRAGIILLLTIFMMERRYGTQWYNSIKGFLK